MDNIAHDIRSPVARMRGMAESMLNEPGTQPLAGKVVEDCDRILNLIKILLEISAAESGLVTGEAKPLDLGEIIREAAELFGPLLEMKTLRLSLDLEGEAILCADPKVMQRVVANLVDNAIKYTPEGGRITIRLHREHRRILFSVEDTGIGVEQEALERIFDRFYRGDASRSQPGSGLGLSFCRAAIEAMNGVIECRSTPGEGSVFTVALPRR